MAIRLLIADDHPVVRSGLRRLLANTDIEIVAEASTGDEALQLAAQGTYDVALLDVRLPQGDGQRIVDAALHLLPDAVRVDGC